MSLDVYEDEPRTPFDLIRDFVEYLREHEWEDTTESCGRGCCRDWVRKCPECGAIADGERYNRKGGPEPHKDGCRWQSLMTEAEAMLAAEEARREAEEAEQERQHSGKTSWQHLDEALP